ncbi:hypothetical protein SAMN05421741_1111 [Paenimyroides ummariense]|uniref:Uncharacterized protein n=1 Tax=Paenimyroides ummariense TaxID=913024 RepID=A0A1I5BX51_9FLAO|nr:hypothetical protein [Paenimyroides ummariense]SFN79162.1 hypothetical protein SAMN05421741_1111 [Paenimyroides ummariense]
MNKYVLIIALLTLQLSYGQNQEQQATQQNIENTKPKALASFIVFSITDQSNAEEYLKFKEKYNVNIKFESCAVDVSLFSKAKKNNKELANLLTEQYGTAWMEELPCGLVGVDLEK